MYLISVYITSFNKGKYLSQAITSVLNQSLQPEEIIIVDDGSNDNSREIIKGFSSRYPEIIKSIINENNYGIAKTRNIAISHCKGELITFVDGEDYFFPSKLESELKIIRNGNFGCVYANHVFIDEFNNKLKYFSDKDDSPSEGNIFLENFTRTFNVSSGSNFHNEMFYKNNAIEIGMYDENIKIWEDWDFRIRMSKKYQYGYCNEVNSAYRKYSDGLHNSDIKLHFREQIKIYNKNKPLTADLINEERAIISNRVYAKIKYLFLEIIRKSIQEKKIFQAIINSLYFILTFKTRKSISTAYKALIKN